MSTYDTLMHGIKKNEETGEKPEPESSPPIVQDMAVPQIRSFADSQKSERLTPKRKITYQGIGIYEDQFFKLRRLQADILDSTHKKASFAEILGEALDIYFKKKGI